MSYVQTRPQRPSTSATGPTPARFGQKIGNRYVSCPDVTPTAFPIFPAMLGDDGKPKPDIFLKDNLHMNAKGYAIWVPIVRPYLK